MDAIENLTENECPGKRHFVGHFAMTNDKILLFGGVSEQQGCSRDTCFIYDVAQGTILKTADIQMTQPDAFPCDGYSYYEDDNCYLVAGRYYVH